jgi:RNA polymerase sigma-70 factor (ECF subfamily)
MLTIVFGAVVLGGLFLVAYAFTSRQRQRELAVRERIALIEKRLVPAHYLRGVRYEALAESLDVPLGTVKTHLHRAKRRLRELLSEM